MVGFVIEVVIENVFGFFYFLIKNFIELVW